MEKNVKLGIILFALLWTGGVAGGLLVGITVGRTHPQPVAGPRKDVCVFTYEATNQIDGRHKMWCLNPVDRTNGLAVPFTQRDIDMILCIDGRYKVKNCTPLFAAPPVPATTLQ